MSETLKMGKNGNYFDYISTMIWVKKPNVMFILLE